LLIIVLSGHAPQSVRESKDTHVQPYSNLFWSIIRLRSPNSKLCKIRCCVTAVLQALSHVSHARREEV